MLADLSDAEVDQIILPPLSEDLFHEDLNRVTEDQTDPMLADLLIGRSRETMVWMRYPYQGDHQ